jgi:AraC family transcriptional regulator of adaptative response / DNA-3-methyladenine glycosylase II
VIEDFEGCYRAVLSRDARFDGWFFTAVTSTGIYCRPSCPALTPKRQNVRFYSTAAAAQLAGFRACKRCRPDATPGSPEWDVRADVVGRAMRLIADGVVDREGVEGLASRLGYSPRHVHRQLAAQLGAGPLALARSQRAQTARVLIETTDLSFAHVAFAAGFASIRQFNDTVREVFAVTPTDLRHRQRRSGDPTPGVISLRLAYRAPLDAVRLFEFLARRAVPGLETSEDGAYRRSLRLAHGNGTVTLSDAGDHVACRLRLDDGRDLSSAVERCRRLLDLDADPVAVDGLLGADPLLAAHVSAGPGRRVPRTVDGAELAVRAILGQQVSVVGARTLTARLVARFGKPLTTPDGTLTHLFPEATALADADPAELGVPAARGHALRGVASAVAEGRLCLDPGADRQEAIANLLALPGIGPWTAQYVAMRALGDPDAFLPADLGVRRALVGLDQPGDPASAAATAQRWRPWRAYALQYLWGTLDPTSTSDSPNTRAKER